MSLIGIDTGGTFTDFIWVDEAGALRLHKQPSTPEDPSRAVLLGLAESNVPPADVIHGSTVATNALLERRGARTALIATQGFADVLEIGRQNRPDLYALVPQKPSPLVPRGRRFEARERIGAGGVVLEALDERHLATLLDQLAAERVESVAVCLLFSFLVPDHEQRIGAMLRERFGDALSITLSSDILPEYREFERTAATVINAYVSPSMSRYLARLGRSLAPRRLSIMQSSGGIIDVAQAGAQAARTVLSGPAGGVVGARFVASAAGVRGEGFSDIITFDMGGTSTDVSLCPGHTPTTTEGDIGGLPLRLPLIDIHTVGAGGGSLAYIDAGGALQVGPESAGAMPGPACYHADYEAWRRALRDIFPAGRATVTDANLVLGRLATERFLGGQMTLHKASAGRALEALAGEMGATAHAAALSVLRVANATMDRAIRRISVERGHDPRRFTLVAFGGGGPLHACELAAELRIPRVLIPRSPGVLSALGMLTADPTRDYSQTVMVPADGLTAAQLDAAFAPLADRARHEMAAAGHELSRLALRRSLDMRYTGQSFELSVPVQPEDDPAALVIAFHEAHRARYGYARPEAQVEVVTIRLSAVAPTRLTSIPLEATEGVVAQPPVAAGRRRVWFGDDGPVEALTYERDVLRPGHHLAGPAVIYQYDTTTLLPPGWSAVVDGQRNLLAEKQVSLSE